MKRWIITVLLVVCVMLSACGSVHVSVTVPTGETTAPTETTQKPVDVTQPVPTEPAPTEPAPTRPVPTEPAPTQPAPTEPAPTQPAPTEPAPTQPAPTEPAPTQPAPTEPAPTQPAPTEPAPTEHKHSYTTEVFQPTCERNGYTQHTCQTCGDSYPSDIIDHLGHDYVSAVVAPTCKMNGYTENTCKRCGFIYKTDYTATNGHSWSSWTITKEPTYTEKGVWQRQCESCGEVQEQYAPDPVLTEAQSREAIFQLINIEREKAGLAPLVYLTEAQKAADIRVLEIRELFDHVRPNGTQYVTLLQEQGIKYQYVGENLAVNLEASWFRTLVNYWMASEKNRGNILNPNFKSMVVGAKEDSWVVIFVG